MSEEKTDDGQNTKSERQPYKVRLPGFVTDEELGFGDVITRATATIAIRLCGGCQRRATALNRWLVFTGRHAK